MYRHLCIGFISLMLKVKHLLEYKNLFSPKEYEENDKTMQNIFNK